MARIKKTLMKKMRKMAQLQTERRVRNIVKYGYPPHTNVMNTGEYFSGIRLAEYRTPRFNEQILLSKAVAFHDASQVGRVYRGEYGVFR